MASPSAALNSATPSSAKRCGAAEEDRLSSLPDEILINDILPRLPFLEAQRTSVLGRRWRSLWSFLPGLDLDGSRKVARFRPDPRIRAGVSEKEIEEAPSKYAEWVDRTVAAYRGTAAPLRHFRVLFRLGASNSSNIDSWLEFSLRQGVEILELDCCYTLGFPSYRFGLSVDRSLFPNTRFLKSLTLKALHMPDDSLRDLLLACEFLETLHLAHLSCLTRFDVTGPVSRLRHIDISCCYKLLSITIRAPTPDLVSFRYAHPLDQLEGMTVLVEHAPRMVDLRLHASHCGTVNPLFRYLPQLETLGIVYSSDDEDIHPSRDFPPLSRLKHLKLDFVEFADPKFIRRKLRCLASLIKIAPVLQHLTLELGGHGNSLTITKELAFMGLQLPVPVIEIAGLNWSQEADRELALRLIRASPSLEKLIVDRRDPLLRGFKHAPYQYSEKTLKRWDKVLREVIEPKLPSEANLIII